MLLEILVVAVPVEPGVVALHTGSSVIARSGLFLLQVLHLLQGKMREPAPECVPALSLPHEVAAERPPTHILDVAEHPPDLLR